MPAALGAGRGRLGPNPEMWVAIADAENQTKCPRNKKKGGASCAASPSSHDVEAPQVNQFSTCKPGILLK